MARSFIPPFMCRVTTGENWQDVMLSCKKDSPCDSNQHHSCGSDATYFFYPFFYAIASILVSKSLIMAYSVPEKYSLEANGLV